MMSEEQVKFKQFIETNVPALSKLFDWENHELVFTRVDEYLQYPSMGEDMLARFFAGVWLHDNRYEFDIISAVKKLDTPQLHIIYKWLNKPIWP